MGIVCNEIIFRRLDELFEQSTDLAEAANAEVLTYLIEMAKLELQTLRDGERQEHIGSLVRITQRK
jgi:hypothetical protein